MHDEAHDGFEVVAMECHLGLLRHVHPAGMPRALAVPHSLHALSDIGGLEELRSTGEAVCVCV